MKLTEAQERWVAALESGQYTQDTGGHLRSRLGYCCLGVACKLFADELGISRQQNSRGYWRYSADYSEAPPEVVDYLRLRDNLGGLTVAESRYESLAEMNDSGRYDFPALAAFIRANPRKVFK